jgi:hypothetical protein
MPANITATVPYVDTIRYPLISATATQFTVTLMTGDSNLLGTAGSPANIRMNFIAIGN